MKNNSYVHVSVMPTIDDTSVLCYGRDMSRDDPTTIVVVRCGDATIQWSTREEALAWVEHVHATVVAAVSDADLAEMAVTA